MGVIWITLTIYCWITFSKFFNPEKILSLYRFLYIDVKKGSAVLVNFSKISQ